MHDQRAHFTEPSRQHQRSALSVTIDSGAVKAGHSAATVGSSSSSPTIQRPHYAQQAAHSTDASASGGLRHASFAEADPKGCVPVHRSVLRLFRRKQQDHHRTSSSVSHMEASGLRASASAGTEMSDNTSSTTDFGGYMRSKRINRAITTLSAQRTRSELAITGPPPLVAARSDQNVYARSPRPQLPPSSISTPALTTASGSSTRLHVSQANSRSQKVYKGTIVPLRSTSALKVVIPAIDGLVEEISESMAACDVGDRDGDRDRDCPRPRARATFEDDITDAVNTGAGASTDMANASRTAESTPSSIKPFKLAALPGSKLSQMSRSPRKSISSININQALYSNQESDVDQHTVSDDEVLANTNPEVAVHVLPDDSSDWNSDFSSPTSWRRSSDRPMSRRSPYRLTAGSRLKDRAIDRSVLDAQHKVLQQEKYLLQISNLSNALAKLRPLILRCLVFELPDRGIRIGTSTFVSAIREPCGSIEPSVEEERLWELWRQAEALLTIMDNDNVPMNNVESRLTLSKKRAIMLAFSDWEQYSLYVQDAWDKARKGIDQPDDEHDRRHSFSNDMPSEDPGTADTQGQWGNSSPRTSYDGCSVAGGFSPISPRAMMRFSLSKQRRCRRQSVVGAAPASLQRIADEATSIREECEQLLALMSPLYRDGQLSARSTMTATSPAAATAATVVAAELQPTAMPTPPLMSGSFSFRSSLSFDSNHPRPSSMLIDEAHLTTF